MVEKDGYCVIGCLMPNSTWGKIYIFDWRKENPALHLLYVKWAVKHLAIINRQIQELCDLSNGTVLDMIVAMQEQRDKLINENAAFADANEILESLKKPNDCEDIE